MTIASQLPAAPAQARAEVVMSEAAARTHDPGAITNPGQAAELDLTIFVSCYNEEAYIVGTLETIRSALAEVGGISYEIIVIDDCSSDHSFEVVESYIASNCNDRILLRHNRIN